MIGILQNKNLTDAKMKKLVDEHWENVKKHIVGKKNNAVALDNINKEVKKIFGASVSFENIVKADYIELQRLKNMWDLVTNNSKRKKIKGKALYGKIYDKWRTKHGNQLVKELELTVCAYCNRNYINGGSGADFDHFFEKSDNQIFALSFYNLIPVCPVCNRAKEYYKRRYNGKNKQLPTHISPYDNDKEKATDELLTFSYRYITATDCEPYIKRIHNPDMKNNVEAFKLEERYSIHTDLVSELHYRAMKYN